LTSQFDIGLQKVVAQQVQTAARSQEEVAKDDCESANDESASATQVYHHDISLDVSI
jgi:hypothetical protein